MGYREELLEHERIGEKIGEKAAVISLIHIYKNDGIISKEIAKILHQKEDFVSEIFHLINSNPDMDDTSIAKLYIEKHN